MKIRINPHSTAPIYEQMIDQIVAAIEANRLGTGDKLPSIRALSAQLGINPNTTARVYRELELRGFIDSRTGSGCFVRPQNEAAAAKAKTDCMQKLFSHMVIEARAQRIDEQDLLQFIKQKST